MKVHSINTYSGSRTGQAHKTAGRVARESVKERHNINNNVIKNNNEEINTSIRKNPDARVSFKGAPFIHKAANFASDNPLVAEALFALAITCGLRPLTIMATAKSDEDKEKCSYQAAKSVSSGLVGLATTALVGMPIAAATKAADKKGAFAIPEEIKAKASETVKKGVDALKEKAAEFPEIAGVKVNELIEGNKINSNIFKKAGKNAEKNFMEVVKEKLPETADKIGAAVKEQRVLDNYAKTGKNVADKLFQPIFMPLRATITIAMVPVILGLLGLKKPGKKPEEQQVQNPFKNMDLNFGQRTTSNIFEEFSGATK